MTGNHTSKKPVKKDFQKSKVYSWETEYVKRDKNIVPFHEIQPIVDYIWKDMGLIGPPKVRLLPPQATTMSARADRSVLEVDKRGINTAIILHELAHSMTSILDGNAEAHGPDFVGMYMQLLNRYNNIPLFEMWYTANKQGVKFNPNVQPYHI